MKIISLIALLGPHIEDDDLLTAVEGAQVTDIDHDAAAKPGGHGRLFSAFRCPAPR